MWQPALKKHLHENSASHINGIQQNEYAANLLQMQKLHLTDLLPPLTTTAAVPLVSQSLNTNAGTTSLMESIPAITLDSSSPSLINNLQQYLRHRGGKSATTATPEQWPLG
ncbi:hypothetical protein EVAR_71287_1 [Eumeta japonica]|uniref:Uncharacterized protein n=1 Tax=Eumeta variegata TaxID=151549 RepID=A0A4C1T0F2_EUMVA|nr:hypothetical protein EVAR_71287_1 [Eumeta japonica]